MKWYIITFCFVIGIFLGIFIYPDHTQQYVELIQKYSAQAGVDPLLIQGIIYAESKGKPVAVSSKGAIGLMQLMPKTAASLASELGLPIPKEEDLTDPDLNIKLGTYYVAKLSRIFQEDTYFIIASYNAGPTKVRKWAREHIALPSNEVIEVAGYPETKQYVRRVLDFIYQKKGKPKNETIPK